MKTHKTHGCKDMKRLRFLEPNIGWIQCYQVPFGTCLLTKISSTFTLPDPNNFLQFLFSLQSVHLFALRSFGKDTPSTSTHSFPFLPFFPSCQRNLQLFHTFTFLTVAHKSTFSLPWEISLHSQLTRYGATDRNNCQNVVVYY